MSIAFSIESSTNRGVTSPIKFLLVFIAASLGFSASVQVKAQSTEPTFKLCEQFSPKMSDGDMEWLRWRMMESFPAQYLPILKSIELVEVDDDELLGPRYLPGNNPRVELPKRFYRRQCLQVLFQAVYDARPNADYSRVEEAIDSCVDAGRPPPACLEGALTGFLLASRQDADLASIVASQKGVAFNTFGAAMFLVSHEAGHAVLRATLSPAQLADTDEETEADLLALLAFLQNYAVPLGPALSLASVSLAEPDNPFFAVTHEPARCRYRRVRALVDAVWQPTLNAEALSKGRRPYSRKELATAESEYQLDILAGQAGEDDCLEVDDSALEAARLDMIRMVDVAATVDTGTLPDRRAKRALEALQAVPVTTRLGERLKAGLSLGLIQRSQSFVDNLNRSGASIDGDVVAGTVATLDRILSLSAGFDATGASPRSQALLEFFRASRNWFSSPRGSGILANARSAMTDLERVFALEDPVQAVRLSAYVQQNSHGFAEFDLNMSRLAVEMYSQQQILLGDCDDPAMQDRLLYRRILIARGQTSPIMSVRACRQYKLRTIDHLQRNFGWRWDGPPL